MQQNEDFFKNIKNMDQKQLKKTMQAAMGSLNGAQQRQLKNITSDAQKMEQIKSKIRPEDIAMLKAHMGSAEELRAFLKRPDIQKRIGEIL